MRTGKSAPQPVEPRRIVLDCDSPEGHPPHTWLVLVTRWDAETLTRYWCRGIGGYEVLNVDGLLDGD